MEAPKLRYRRQRFLRGRIDPDAPLVAARMYRGGVPVVLAQRERIGPRSTPIETIPITMSELRRQIDIERDYIASPDDMPSVLGVSRAAEEYTRQLAPATADRSTIISAPRSTIPEQSPSVVTTSSASPSSVVREYASPSTTVSAPYASPGRRIDVPSALLPASVLRGLGAADGEQAMVGAAGVAILALAVGGGYFAGAAMAPSASDRVAYGVLGSVLGLFTGPIGLGAMGLVALSRK